MIMHIQSPGIVRTVYSSIQGHWYIICHTHRRATKEERGGVSCSFWELKKVSWFGKKRPGLRPSLVKCSIQSVYFTVYIKQKSPKCFPVGSLFYVSLTKCLSIFPVPHPSFLCPEKFLGVQLHSGIIPFTKHFMLNVWEIFYYLPVSITGQ